MYEGVRDPMVLRLREGLLHRMLEVLVNTMTNWMSSPPTQRSNCHRMRVLCRRQTLCRITVFLRCAASVVTAACCILEAPHISTKRVQVLNWRWQEPPKRPSDEKDFLVACGIRDACESNNVFGIEGHRTEYTRHLEYAVNTFMSR